MFWLSLVGSLLPLLIHLPPLLSACGMLVQLLSIYDHSNITGHNTTPDNFSIVGREDQNLMRLIKEAIYIRVNNPSLNKNIGKYHLPHIWDEVLNNITELKLK